MLAIQYTAEYGVVYSHDDWLRAVAYWHGPGSQERIYCIILAQEKIKIKIRSMVSTECI